MITWKLFIKKFYFLFRFFVCLVERTGKVFTFSTCDDVCVKGERGWGILRTKRPSQNKGRILGRNPDKSHKSFPPCYSQSPLQSTALPWDIYFFKLTQLLTYFYISVTVHCQIERRKTERNPYPLPYGLRNLYRNLKSADSRDLAQKPQRNCTSMNSASVHIYMYMWSPSGQRMRWVLHHHVLDSVFNQEWVGGL